MRITPRARVHARRSAVSAAPRSAFETHGRTRFFWARRHKSRVLAAVAAGAAALAGHHAKERRPHDKMQRNGRGPDADRTWVWPFIPLEPREQGLWAKFQRGIRIFLPKLRIPATRPGRVRFFKLYRVGRVRESATAVSPWAVRLSVQRLGERAQFHDEERAQLEDAPRDASVSSNPIVWGAPAAVSPISSGVRGRGFDGICPAAARGIASHHPTTPQQSRWKERGPSPSKRCAAATVGQGRCAAATVGQGPAGAHRTEVPGGGGGVQRRRRRRPAASTVTAAGAGVASRRVGGAV
eukprot:gene23204-biopygen8837